MSLKQPVKYPVKYYSHADANAPQLSNTDGAIKSILKSCLVTGYTGKAGAGWALLFDDAHRIVVKAPDAALRGYPAVKVENGVINSTASHRIISQENPVSISDTNELTSVNMLARDSSLGVEWHLVVSDFGFVLCYQMGYSSASNPRNNLMYVGGAKKWLDTDNEYFVAPMYANVQKSGITTANTFALFDANNRMRDMRTGLDYKTDNAVLTALKAEGFYNNDYLAQPVNIDFAFDLPFFCSVPMVTGDMVTAEISVGGRPMLRYLTRLVVATGSRPMYIPLDYWEL